jgi:DNA-binding NtrC family response regulator
MSTILLVDDELNIITVLNTLLKAEGYEILTSRTAEKAQELIRTKSIDLMIADIRMSPINGMELLKWIRGERPDIAVIMLTAFGSVDTAIDAMKLGAFDYVTKPFKVDELLITIKRALEYRKAITENPNLKNQLITRYRMENIVAESQAMKEVCEMIERVAPTDTTVLIYGESGTGKELVAKAIHAYSPRKEAKFLAVNCAALPEPLLESEMFGHVKGSFTGASFDKKGLFEAVEDGTIFLDEISSMPLSIQAKLLRALQEKEIRRVGGNETIKVHARVLAATNTQLEDLVQAGTFRQDLYYRLSVIPVIIQPLRNRKEDIIPLVHHLIREEIGRTREPPTIEPEVRQILETYSWPGNVRELQNAIKHAITFARENKITPDVLPPKIVSAVGELSSAAPASPTLGLSAHQFESLKAFIQIEEKKYLQQVLSNVGGDKEKAASALKISLATLYRKLPKEQQESLNP